MKNIREIFDLRHRKALRIGVLLLSTLLITSASALVFYNLTASVTTTTSAAVVKFVSTPDTPTGTVISTAGVFATMSIKSYPNATNTYQNALNVSNTDSVSHQIQITQVSITSGCTSYTAATSKIEFDMLNVAGTKTGTAIVNTGATSCTLWTTSATTTGYFTILAGTKWSIQVITSADAGAATGVTTGIQLQVNVQ